MVDAKRVSLAEIHKRLQDRGLRPIDYKHLSYAELRRLAGLGQ